MTLADPSWTVPQTLVSGPIALRGQCWADDGLTDRYTHRPDQRGPLSGFRQGDAADTAPS
jgi:hypothetical protein